MAIIQLLLAVIILGAIYKKMMGWNTSGAISKKQAYLPVALGVVSTILAFFVVLGIALLFLRLGYTVESIQNPALHAVVSAFLKAGLSEELAKLLMILLSIKVLHPRNVYECALIGGAVGIGFTLHEEFLYGGSLMGLSRFITLLVHMALGIVMGKCIGMGMHRKQTGMPYRSLYAFSVMMPMAIHTIYDACTACNPALKELEHADDAVVAGELLAGLMCVACAAVWQCLVVRSLKKHASEYSAMNLK